MRRYKSGSKWAFWRWTLTPSGYIKRLHLVQTPFGSIMVHFINGPDPEPDMHDHPTTFLSIILWGSYTERREMVDGAPVWLWGKSVVDRRWWNFVRATDCHKIVSVRPNTTTVCFMTKTLRKWGFHTPDGWVYWKDYNKHMYKERAE